MVLKIERSVSSQQEFCFSGWIRTTDIAGARGAACRVKFVNNQAAFATGLQVAGYPVCCAAHSRVMGQPCNLAKIFRKRQHCDSLMAMSDRATAHPTAADETGLRGSKGDWTASKLRLSLAALTLRKQVNSALAA